MSTKAEGIAERIVDVAFAGFVESEIEAAVDLRVVVKVVDGGRNDAILQGQHTSDGLDGTSTTQKVTRHRLGGIKADVEGMVAKHLFDGNRLGQVASRG